MKVLHLITPILFGLTMATAAHAEDKVLRIATEGAFYPGNFTKPDGSLDGFEIELAKDLCTRMKVTCEIAAQDWDGLIPSLNAGKYDAIMASMSITDKRLEVVDFSIPYIRVSLAFATMGDGPLADLPGTGTVVNLDDEAAAGPAIAALHEALKGKTIGAQTATVGVDYLTKAFGGDITLNEYKSAEQSDLDLLAGRVDAVFAGAPILAASLSKPEMKGVKIAGYTLSGSMFGRGAGVAVRKGGDALKTDFNEAIRAAAADGTMSKLFVKWYGIDLTPEWK